MERIGGTLRAVRRRRKLTLREVAQRSHIFARQRGDRSYQISASWLGRLEQEEHNLKVNKLIVLAYIYDVPPEHLLGFIYPDSLIQNQSLDATTLVSPESALLPGPYKWGIIGKHDRTLEPLVPGGSLVQIDTQRRMISPNKAWTHGLQRPIYFLTSPDGYFCGWCELDAAEKSLTLVPHPLSPAISRSWKYRIDVEIIGRVIAVEIQVSVDDDLPGSSRHALRNSRTLVPASLR